MPKQKKSKQTVKGVVMKTDLKNKSVLWYDAVQKNVPTEWLKNVTEKTSCIDHLAKNTTYGRVIKAKDVVIITHEISTDETTDATFIPKDWVISIE